MAGSYLSGCRAAGLPSLMRTGRYPEVHTRGRQGELSVGLRGGELGEAAKGAEGRARLVPVVRRMDEEYARNTVARNIIFNRREAHLSWSGAAGAAEGAGPRGRCWRALERCSSSRVGMGCPRIRRNSSASSSRGSGRSESPAASIPVHYFRLHHILFI